MQPQLYVVWYYGHHARIGSITTMTTDGVVKPAVLRRMNEESRCNVDTWNALRGLPWDETETGAEDDLNSSICLSRHVGAMSQEQT